MNTPGGPKASPATLPALATDLAPCAPLFRRATSRARGERSRPGLRTALPRQPWATIAAAVAGPATARWPPLWTAAPWEPQALAQQRVTACVAPRPPQGLLVLDAPGRPQPGRHAGGVARQSSGPLGQGAPCQGGGSAH